MHVIGLHAEVQHAERPAGSRRERSANGAEDALAAERRDGRGGTQRDVDGNAGIVRGSAPVRNRSSSRCRWTTGARTTTAPCPEDERTLSAVRHLELGIVYSKLAVVSRMTAWVAVGSCVPVHGQRSGRTLCLRAAVGTAGAELPKTDISGRGAGLPLGARTSLDPGSWNVAAVSTRMTPPRGGT